MHTVPLTTGQGADLLLLIAALEPEPARVRARGDLPFAQRDFLFSARNFLPGALVRLERGAALVDIGDLHGFAEHQLARVRLLLPDDHAEEGRLAGAVRPDDPDDPGPWQA